jgi:outer membrane protein
MPAAVRKTAAFDLNQSCAIGLFGLRVALIPGRRPQPHKSHAANALDSNYEDLIMKTRYLSVYVMACCVTAALAAPAARAHERGDWLIRGGFHTVDPKSDNGDVVEVKDDTMFTFNITYMLSPNWGLELLAALPFEHEIALVDGPTVASTKQLPPTFSAVYHFLPERQFQPYVGLGVNVTLFFDEDTRGPLAGADLDLDNSVGAAAVAGLDVDLGSNWFMNVDVRYLDIDTDAKLNGVKLETVKIDPWAFGVNVGYRF